MKFEIEVTWVHNPTGITESVTLSVFCSSSSTPLDRGYAADNVCDEWYYDSATEAAMTWYNENCMDLEGVTLDDFVDGFLEDCFVEWHLKV
jgi:hypothetical protein